MSEGKGNVQRFVNLCCLGEGGHQEVVDNVGGEEEGVDEAPVLVSKGLRRHGRLQ